MGFANACVNLLTSWPACMPACLPSGCGLVPMSPRVHAYTHAHANSSAPYVSESFGTTATTSTQDDDSSSDSLHALVSGPHWRLLLSARELSEFVHMLSQLRMAVASLRFQGLWQAGGTDRPPSRAKVCMSEGVRVCMNVV